MLADTEVQVAAGVVALRDAQTVVDVRVVRRREVGGAADELGDTGSQALDDLAARRAGRETLGVGLEGGQLRVPALGQLAGERALELGSELGVRRAVGLELGLPGLAGLDATRLVIHVRGDVVGHEELLVLGPAVVGLRELDLLIAKRRAMSLGGVLLVRGTGRDVRAQHDDRRTVVLLGRVDRGAHVVERPAVLEALRVPAKCLEALRHVLGEGQAGVALDRDPVVVVDHRELAELEVPTERRGLLGHTLHQVAVGADAEHAVVDDLVAGTVVARSEHALGERETDHVADALAERSGRNLDARRVAELRVAWRERAPLAELLEVLKRDVVAREVQRGVLEHAGVARREDEAVTTGPVRLLRVVLHVLVEVEIRDRRQRHRGARMTRIRLLHAIHREGADGVDRAVDEIGHEGPPGDAWVRLAMRRARNASRPRRTGIPIKQPISEPTAPAIHALMPRPGIQISDPATAKASGSQNGRNAAPRIANGMIIAAPSPSHIACISVIAPQPTRGVHPLAGTPRRLGCRP